MKRYFYLLIAMWLMATMVKAQEPYLTIHKPVSVEYWFTPYQANLVEPMLVGLIDNAQSRIRMAAYGLTSKDIVQALINAHNRGVDVSLVVDKTQAAGKAERVQIAALMDAGVPVKIGQSAKHQLQHAKFMVIDQQIEEDGSFNFSPSALKQDNFVDVSKEPARVAAFEYFWQKIFDDM